MRKPIDPRKYKIKFIKDLGMKTDEKNKISKRIIILECPFCFKQFEVDANNGKIRTGCKKCSKEIADEKKRKAIDASKFKMKFIKDIRSKRKGHYLMECSNCEKHIEVRMDAVERGQKYCEECNFDINSTAGGLSKTSKLYPIWHSMMRRCYDPKRKDYGRYGEIGVTVSQEFHDFSTFHDFCMNNGWEDGLHVEKDKLCIEKSISPHIYSRETICFISPSENSRIASGKRIDRFNLNGEYIDTFSSAIEAAEAIGIPRQNDNITSACRGKIKTSSGYIWKYSTEN